MFTFCVLNKEMHTKEINIKISTLYLLWRKFHILSLIFFLKQKYRIVAEYNNILEKCAV